MLAGPSYGLNNAASIALSIEDALVGTAPHPLRVVKTPQSAGQATRPRSGRLTVAGARQETQR